MTDDISITRGFDICTDTEAEKMTVQLRLRDNDHECEWHSLNRIEASILVDRLDSAIWQLRTAENKRCMTPAKRGRYHELLKANTQGPLDETDRGELRELHRAAVGAGIDILEELAVAFEPSEENHSDR